MSIIYMRHDIDWVYVELQFKIICVVIDTDLWRLYIGIV